ncbi:MAG: hypothetical protein LBQ31_08935 [Bacteroidales bacterium]|jgi:hypothetical protein|nr:hypothetical protein [Bacteroidales bacterium]
MKNIIALILAVFVFTLSVSDVLIETIGHSDCIEACENGQTGEDHCPQGCSPFHSCCTSLGFTVPTAFFTEKFITIVSESFSILYISPLTSIFAGDIWQPPKK